MQRVALLERRGGRSSLGRPQHLISKVKFEMQLRGVVALLSSRDDRKLRFDIYRGRKDRTLRLATLSGAKLPTHLSPKIGPLFRRKIPQYTPMPLGTLPPRAIAFFKWSLEINHQHTVTTGPVRYRPVTRRSQKQSGSQRSDAAARSTNGACASLRAHSGWLHMHRDPQRSVPVRRQGHAGKIQRRSRPRGCTRLVAPA